MDKYYKLLYSELNFIICDWDPYGLSNNGEITDEFSQEVTLILAGLKDIDNSQSTIEMVSNVFSKYFSPDDFSIQACTDVGVIIYKWWIAKKMNVCKIWS